MDNFALQFCKLGLQSDLLPDTTGGEGIRPVAAMHGKEREREGVRWVCEGKGRWWGLIPPPSYPERERGVTSTSSVLCMYTQLIRPPDFPLSNFGGGRLSLMKFACPTH